MCPSSISKDEFLPDFRMEPFSTETPLMERTLFTEALYPSIAIPLQRVGLPASSRTVILLDFGAETVCTSILLSRSIASVSTLIPKLLRNFTL